MVAGRRELGYSSVSHTPHNPAVPKGSYNRARVRPEMASADWRDSSLRPSLPRAKPFLKWAGGKGQLLSQLKEYIPRPEEGQGYFEPFLGAGAVFFSIQPRKATLGDVNKPLIETYKVVRTRHTDLIRVLTELATNPDSDEYYARRKEFNELVPAVSELGPQERVRLASLFIWLNHTCYNGLFRVNRSGLFNVPFSSNTEPSIFSATNLRAANMTLKRADVKLLSADYRETLKDASEGDVVYLNPPYDPTNNTASFTSYSAGGFDSVDQVELSREVRNLVDRGCRVYLTNSSTPAIKELYRDFEIRELDARRAINCQGDRRGKVKETLVIG